MNRQPTSSTHSGSHHDASPSASGAGPGRGLIDLDALATASRLERMGLVVRSPELVDQAKRLAEFNARGGNRAMRRAAKRRRSR